MIIYNIKQLIYVRIFIYRFWIKDFLRDVTGDVLTKDFDSFDEAEEWLLDNGQYYGWTNEGVKYWCWDVETGEVDIDDVN